jgi:F0F1-type ATP synthase assembly protein I
MADKGRLPGWVRYSGVGVELAGAVAGFALVGYWIDGHYGSRPWGMLVGLALGLIGGLYNLVKKSLQAEREARIEDAAGQSGPADSEGSAD